MSLKINVSKYLPINDLRVSSRPFGKSAIPQLLLAHEAKDLLNTILRKPRGNKKTPLLTDHWGFFYYWEMIKNKYPSVDALYNEIRIRKSTIQKIRETFRSKITDLALLPFTTGVSASGTYSLHPDRVHLTQEGISGTYFLSDEKNQPRFVIKPLDEEPGCLNNPKGFATPFGDKNPIRSYIPLYGSALREATAYQIASLIGISSVVPKTHLAIFESDRFSDLTDRMSDSEVKNYIHHTGDVDREKLCSVQEFVSNSKTLFEGLQEFQMAGLSDEEIAIRFDRQDFEEANLLIWTTYDTDAHSGNILVYPKGVDAIGNEILGIKKIDNGLSFPTENKQLRNHLQYHPCANQPLSDLTRSKIKAMNPDRMAALMRSNGLESAIPAMYERIAHLKNLTQNPLLTIREINIQMGDHFS